MNLAFGLFRLQLLMEVPKFGDKPKIVVRRRQQKRHVDKFYFKSIIAMKSGGWIL